MKKSFKVNTSFIQWLIMDNMFSELYSTMTKADREKIDSVLGEMNDMCNEENDYTVTVTVEG